MVGCIDFLFIYTFGNTDMFNVELRYVYVHVWLAECRCTGITIIKILDHIAVMEKGAVRDAFDCSVQRCLNANITIAVSYVFRHKLSGASTHLAKYPQT